MMKTLLEELGIESKAFSFVDATDITNVTVAAADLANTLAEWLEIVNAGLKKAVALGGEICPSYFY